MIQQSSARQSSAASEPVSTLHTLTESLLQALEKCLQIIEYGICKWPWPLCRLCRGTFVDSFFAAK